jgi:hypothetical protein
VCATCVSSFQASKREQQLLQLPRTIRLNRGFDYSLRKGIEIKAAPSSLGFSIIMGNDTSPLWSNSSLGCDVGVALFSPQLFLA